MAQNGYIIEFGANVNEQDLEKSVINAKNQIEKDPKTQIQLKFDSSMSSKEIEKIKTAFIEIKNVVEKPLDIGLDNVKAIEGIDNTQKRLDLLQSRASKQLLLKVNTKEIDYDLSYLSNQINMIQEELDFANSSDVDENERGLWYAGIHDEMNAVDSKLAGINVEQTASANLMQDQKTLLDSINKEMQETYSIQKKINDAEKNSKSGTYNTAENEKYIKSLNESLNASKARTSELVNSASQLGIVEQATIAYNNGLYKLTELEQKNASQSKDRANVVKQLDTALKAYNKTVLELNTQQSKLNASVGNNSGAQEYINSLKQTEIQQQKNIANIKETMSAMGMLNVYVEKYTNSEKELQLQQTKNQGVEIAKQQTSALNELDSALKKRNQLELELTKTTGLMNEESAYRTQEQYDYINSLQTSLSAENDRISTLSETAKQLGVETEATKKVEDANTSAAQAKAKFNAQSKSQLTVLQKISAGFEDATARIFDYTMIYQGIQYLQQALMEIGRTAKELDSTLVDLQIVTGGTKEETRDLIDTYSELGSTLGATTIQVAESANDFLRQGLSIEDTNKMIESSIVLSKLGMIESAEATEYLTSATKGYKVSADEAIGIVDQLVTVDMNAAVSAGYLAEAMARTANSANLAGVEMETLLGYIATIGETTQRSAATVGESLKTMLARFGNVKAGEFAAEGEDMENLNDIETVFGSIGIAIRESSSEMRDFDDVLNDLSSSWGTLTDVERNAVATAAAGTRQRENFLVLMENYNSALRLESDAYDSAGTSSEKYKAYQDSLEASISKLRATFEGMVNDGNLAEFMKFWVDFANEALNVIDKLNLVQVGLVSLGVLISTKIIKYFQTMATANMNAKASFNDFNISVSQHKGNLENYAGALTQLNAKQKTSAINALIKTGAFKDMNSQTLINKLSTLGLTEAESKNVAMRIIASRETIKNAKATGTDTISKKANAIATGTATKAQLGLNAAMKAFLPGLIITGIITAITAIGDYIDSLETATEKYDSLVEKISENNSKIDELQSKYDEDKARLEELISLQEERNLYIEEEIELQKLSNDVELLETRIETEEKLNDILRERKNELQDEAIDTKMAIALGGYEDEDDYKFHRNLSGAKTATSSSFITGQDWQSALANPAFQTGVDFDIQSMMDNAMSDGEMLADAQEYFMNMEEWNTKLKTMELELAETTDASNKAQIQSEINSMNQRIDSANELYNTLTTMRQVYVDAGLETSEEAREIQHRMYRMMVGDGEEYQQTIMQDLMSSLSEEASSALTVLQDNMSEGGEINWETWLNKDMFSEFVQSMEDAGVPIENFITLMEESAEKTRLQRIETAQATVAMEGFGDAAYNDSIGVYADNITSLADKLQFLVDAQYEFQQSGVLSAETMKQLADYDLLQYYDDLKNANWDAGDAMYAAAAAAKQQAFEDLNLQFASDIVTISLAAQGDAAAIASVAEMEASAQASTLAGVLNEQLSSAAYNASDRVNLLNDALTTAGFKDFDGYEAERDKAMENYFNAYDLINDNSFEVELKTVTRTPSSASSSSSSSSSPSSSSSSTDNTDYWKQAFEDELDALQRLRDLDLISEKEYTDRLDALNKKYFAGRAEYLDDYRKYEKEVYDNRVSELEDQRDKELELAEETYDKQVEALEKQQDLLDDQLDAYQEIIDKKQEMLDQAKEEKNYADDMEERNKEILDLENKIEELRFDTSAEGVAKRLELEDELADKIKEKEDEIYNNSIEKQSDALDAESDRYEKFIDDSKATIDNALDDLAKKFEETTQAITNAYQQLIDALNDNLVDGGGAGGSSGGAGGSLSGFGFNIQNLNGQRGDSVKQAQQALNSQYGGNLAVDGIWGSKTQAAYVRAVQQYLNNNFGAGLAVDGIWGSKTQSAWDSAGGGAKPFHKGIEEGFVGGLEGNEQFAKLLKGELVINPSQQDNFMKSILPDLMRNSGDYINNNNGMNVDITLNIEGNVDTDTLPKIQGSIEQALKTLNYRGHVRGAKSFAF